MTPAQLQPATWLLIGPVVVAGAMAATVGLIMLLLPYLQRHALARPNARSSHRIATPQGGGIALIAVTVVSAAVTAMAIPDFGGTVLAQLGPVLAAALLLGLAGALDDMRGLDPLPRLLVQGLCVFIVLAALPVDWRVVPALPWWVERALLLMAGIWCVNLVNFMDGIDWMNVAEIVPVAAGLVLLAHLGALPAAGMVLALALLGSTLGFAVFNRPVAKLFLGDSGSLPTGLLLFWLLVELAGNGHLAAALLLPLYYVADATVTLGRRLVRGERVWQAHRTHFYQRAIDNGLTVLQVVGGVFAVNLALIALAVLTVVVPQPGVKLSALLASGLIVAALLTWFAHGRR